MALATAGLTDDARALDDDAIVVETFAGLRYDSNLFALPDDVTPPIVGRRSATTQSVGLTLRVDKAIGQQQFGIFATVTHLHYDPYDYLDFTSHAYGFHWSWVLTPSLTGSISVDESKEPNSFSDTGFQTSPNPRTQENRRFDIAYRPGAALHPRFAITQVEDKSAQTTIELQNARTSSVEAAVVYDFPSSNTAELYFRRGRGHYFDSTLDPFPEDESQFDEREWGFAAHYDGGVSRFDGRVGYLDRAHRDFMQRNFSGLVAQLGYTFIATAKTQVTVTARRTLGASETSFSSYSRDDSITIEPTWAATGKITVRPSLALTNRDFRGAISSDAEHLTYRMRDASLAVDWDVLRALRLSASVLFSSRDSNDSRFRFTNRGALVNGAFHF